MKNIFYGCLLLATVLLCGISLQSCKKDSPVIDTSLRTTTLYDKPLNVIKAYLQGTWKLDYTKGGICEACIYPGSVDHPLYMTITGSKIVVQSDSRGTVANTSISWKKVDYSPPAQHTYLLTYRDNTGYPFPRTYTVDRLQNDTLILRDAGTDPAYYYYSKMD